MLLALLAACSEPVQDEPIAHPTALPWPTVEGPVWTSVVVSAPAPRPARFDAPWTTVVEDGLDALPVETFAHRLCEGIGGAREASTGQVADPVAWWPVFGAVDCEDPGFCGWLADTLGRLDRDASAALWPAALGCADPRVDERIAQGAPTGVLLAASRERPLPWNDRMATLADSLDEDDRGRRIQLVALLLVADRPEATRALDALRRRYPDEVPDTGGRSVLDLLPEAFQWGVDPMVLAERFPGHRTAVVAGLESCLRTLGETDPLTLRRCGRALVKLDPERASSALAAAEDPYGTLDDVLRRPAAEVRDELVALGLGDRGGSVDGATTVGEVLAAMGHAEVLRFVPRGGEAALAYRLAALAGLDDAVFEVVEPSLDILPSEDRWPRAALFAWHDGRRSRTLLEDDWDPAHTLGLVNALLAADERPVRLAVDHSRAVVAATPEQLRAMADAGLVRWALVDELLEEP
ncbi:MAG: hypothetical protein H6738_21410 [Alphaproteobacteria bacterium]|nr:hypothetical protein [Alphaproteobacteria bacterium]